ncbi:MAG: GGDEF domain-containing protein, partial [Hyphomicrobiales bacterium]|nr:GGDEF domain-containing protein [Hyphomicrobiales bacterium]
IRLRGADSRYHSFILKARPVVNVEGEVVRIIGALSDVTEIKAAEERILHDAIHDNLTGLPNRELFLDRLGSALVQTRRPGAPIFALLTIDVDRFKEINDALGMAFGDSALLTVARRLGRELRPGDTLARIGGDQFGVILMLDDGEAEIPAFIESLREMMASPISFGDREVNLTVSIGVSVYDPELHRKGADLVSDAEIALAHAKKTGGDRAEIFSAEMRSERSDRLSLAQDLRRALDRGEITIMFQPVVRLEDRTVAGFEALLRWRHPRLGLLSPDDFFPVADSNDVLGEIGVFAIETVARELAAWQKALEVTPPIFASINVSTRQIIGHDLLGDLRTALNRHYVLRGTLKLELTENLVMENPEYAVQLLRRIRELGAGLALGDFGAGYTSLSHLQRYRFDTLKIDSSLVRPNGPGGRPAILRSVVTMAHDLGMDVITEGAESESDAVELSQIGCEFAQGYAFGEPMSAAAARKLMGAAPL